MSPIVSNRLCRVQSAVWTSILVKSGGAIKVMGPSVPCRLLVPASITGFIYVKILLLTFGPGERDCVGLLAG